jgi:hypothetical protein
MTYPQWRGTQPFRPEGPLRGVKQGVGSPGRGRKSLLALFMSCYVVCIGV